MLGIKRNRNSKKNMGFFSISSFILSSIFILSLVLVATKNQFFNSELTTILKLSEGTKLSENAFFINMYISKLQWYLLEYEML